MLRCGDSHGTAHSRSCLLCMQSFPFNTNCTLFIEPLSIELPTIGISTEKREDNLVKTLDHLNAFGTNHLSMKITSLLDSTR